MQRSYYAAQIPDFLASSDHECLGQLAGASEFPVEQTQRDSWLQQIWVLKRALQSRTGNIFFEYAIPRMGRRVDVILIIENVLFVIEFKVGMDAYSKGAIDQVWDYALDLKNFHATSRDCTIAPILIATQAASIDQAIVTSIHDDGVLDPLLTNELGLAELIDKTLLFTDGAKINCDIWINGCYSPSPTIIEAAVALYSSHSVIEISRSDASAKNLTVTSSALSRIIERAKQTRRKAICFVTGVPGAGKTLVGLDVVTRHLDKDSQTAGVFLSGNGPLVNILREALVRDRIRQEAINGNKIKKGTATKEVKAFIQNVHHYRDEYLKDTAAPFDHVAIFDEAQRAWSLEQTVQFMKQKKGKADFRMSEPEFLISCLDRHLDWAVVICLVGGGQEINKGEAGISEWINSVIRSFPHWDVFISPHLHDSEYQAATSIDQLKVIGNLHFHEDLHLSVSLRSFRAESMSKLVKEVLDLQPLEAKREYDLIRKRYPIVLSRNLNSAKKWLRDMSRGSERYGLVVSSKAQRLKPYAIDVRSPIDPVHWFLDEKNDTRSSYYLEDAATEFHVQGLELDWACVTWDADFRFVNDRWESFSFVGSKWNRISKPDRVLFLKNAYRVLLTRARQGMVIVIPEGDRNDPTRDPSFYDATFNYLEKIGFEVIA